MDQPEAPGQASTIADTTTDAVQRSVPGSSHDRSILNASSTELSSTITNDTHHGQNGLPGMDEVDMVELHQIATAISRHHTQVGCAPSRDCTLDPESPEFDVARWVQDFVRQWRDKGRAENKLGVAMRDLDVFGSGSALQLQDTVASVLSAPLRVGEMLGGSKKSQRRHILHGFNALLKSGELLAVWGVPGRGAAHF
jgi:ATP-binding cassette subfamily G (WHITE) protein 2 (PDR)